MTEKQKKNLGLALIVALGLLVLWLLMRKLGGDTHLQKVLDNSLDLPSINVPLPPAFPSLTDIGGFSSNNCGCESCYEDNRVRLTSLDVDYGRLYVDAGGTFETVYNTPVAPVYEPAPTETKKKTRNPFLGSFSGGGNPNAIRGRG